MPDEAHPPLSTMPSSLADRRMAAAQRASAALVITSSKVSDEGVEDTDRTWAVNPRDPNEIVGSCPVSVSYYTDSPPGYYEDVLEVRVRFLEGSAVPESLGVDLQEKDHPNAPSRFAEWPQDFLDGERRRAILDEQALLRAEMGPSSTVAPSVRARL